MTANGEIMRIERALPSSNRTSPSARDAKSYVRSFTLPRLIDRENVGRRHIDLLDRDLGSEACFSEPQPELRAHFDA